MGVFLKYLKVLFLFHNVYFSYFFKRIKTKCGNHELSQGGGVAQWLGCRISDQGVPGSNPGRCTFRCGLEQVTFTLLSSTG